MLVHTCCVRYEISFEMKSRNIINLKSSFMSLLIIVSLVVMQAPWFSSIRSHCYGQKRNFVETGNPVFRNCSKIIVSSTFTIVVLNFVANKFRTFIMQSSIWSHCGSLCQNDNCTLRPNQDQFPGMWSKSWEVVELRSTKWSFSAQISTDAYSSRKAWRFLQDTYRKEGFFNLWRGNSATMARIIPYAATQFSAHEQWKKWLKVDSTDHAR